MSTSTSPPTPDTRPLGLAVASVFCWLGSLVTLGFAVAEQLPRIHTLGELLVFALNLTIGVTQGVAGILLYRKRKIGALLLVLAWGLPQIPDLIAGELVRPHGGLLLIAMLLTLANAKHLR